MRASFRSPPSLRRVVVLAIATCAIVAFALVALLWAAGARVDRGSAIARHEQELRLVKELQLELFAYSRLSSMFMATGRSELHAEREMTADEVRALLDEAEERADHQAHELQAIGRTRVSIERYFGERSEAERETNEADRVIARTAESFDRAASAVEQLRSINRGQLDVAYAGAAQLRWLTLAIGTGMAFTLVGALLTLVAWVRRTAYRPLVWLSGALENVATGSGGAADPGEVPIELIPLVHAYEVLCDRLEQQRRDRAAYFGGVAHDLRNPLNGLRAGLEVVRRRAPRDDRMAAMLALLDRQVVDLNRMLGDLLDVARIEGAPVALELEDADLRSLASDAVELYRTADADHPIELSLADAPVSCRCDATRVRQVIGNLLSNAIKFSPKSTTVVVTVERRADEAVVSVADQGVGIAPEALQTIFAPFWRRRGSSAAGTGLGLYVANRIIDAHGGHIEAESVPGMGSTLRLFLPARNAAVRDRRFDHHDDRQQPH